MDYVVETKNLNFKYNNELVIKNLTFNVEKGSRCLLVGGNGSGKTTLLKLISGRKLTENILVLGKNSFRDTSLNFKRNFIDQNWGLRTVAFAGNNIPYVADIKVSEMMKDIQNKYPERKKELLKLLEINENWSMSYISDGQRRRVQIFLGLLRPVELILLDDFMLACYNIIITASNNIVHQTTETTVNSNECYLVCTAVIIFIFLY